jgi:PPP family 3-phenylpropionic acid transporter
MRSAVVLSIYWFLLLGGLGTFFPFYSLYLRENAGLSGSQAGIVLAVLPLVGIAAQPVWGHLADRSGSRTHILTFLSLGAAVGYAALFFARDFPSLLATTAALAIFSSAVIPMCVSVSLALVFDLGPHAFGLVRVWGTVGFFVTVVSFPLFAGSLLELAGIDRLAASVSEPALVMMFPITAACCLAAAAVSLLLPSGGAVAHRAHRTEWRLLLAHGPFVRVVLFMFAAYLCLHGPMVFFPVYVHSLGGDVATVSRMWILMLALEVPLIALSGAGFRRLGGRGLLAAGTASGAARWLVCGLTNDLWLVHAVQILHGVIVAGLIVGAPLYVEAVIPSRLRSTGQGLLSMMGISLGGISSSVLSGWLVDNIGPSAPALFGGVGALALTIALPMLVPRPRRVAASELPPMVATPGSDSLLP